jgi:uncharacterized protein (DUF427 family)
MLRSIESVWDYPRPPRVELSTSRIRVVFVGNVIADTRRALRVLETSHPPTYYIPPEDVSLDLLVERPGRISFCEWKGRATYLDLELDGDHVASAAWVYRAPRQLFGALKDHIAFYASKLDCYVDDERVRAQEGGFYGGWITSRIVGPFKGGPGSRGW